jgi:glyoxylase-like metal-dependent hydrolase (beta-lactamase superfamily II)
MNTSFSSEHFMLHKLAEGVYAAIASELGAGFSNAGLVDLGEHTLVFDAFENPQASQDLLEACRQLTGREPAVTIISHFHPDHWGGLQVFAGSAILATHATRQAMIPLAKEMLKDQQNASRMEKDMRNTEASLEAETSANKRQALQVSIARQRHALQALPNLKPTLPNQTFEKKLVFHGSQRTAELVDTGKAHTKSDCLLKLPQERVAFIGDIGFFQAQPFMPYGFPPKWLAILDNMAGWDIEWFVPGHGPVGSKEDLALEAGYIRILEDMVWRVVQNGGTVEDALDETLPAPYDTWQVKGFRFESNVRSSFSRQSGT